MDAPQSQALFTCLSCSIAFVSPEEQRTHYRSDFHRYNMKRRVASLPPVSASVFDHKVLERKAENAVMAMTKTFRCSLCNKIYTSEGSYITHMNSKKHKESEEKSLLHSSPSTARSGSVPKIQSIGSFETKPKTTASGKKSPLLAETGQVPEDEWSGGETSQAIDAKIAAARSRLSTAHCLFCAHILSTMEDNLTHMSSAHGFFVPDEEYLTDLPGLITYLGEKIAVGNVCIFCNEKSKDFRSMQAVRKHMVDKSHCKIAYESQDDRLEVSDYYDFTDSYPDAKERTSQQRQKDEDDEWEDIANGTGDGAVDEVIDEQFGNDLEDSDLLADTRLKYGDSPFELVLPSGTRIGHRSLKRYYAQRLIGPLQDSSGDPTSGAALVRSLIADKNSALVPMKGGFGAFGLGTAVVKARNRGEAREAGKHIRQFRDQRRREEFKTKVGFIHNSQKHYRDQLLQ